MPQEKYIEQWNKENKNCDPHDYLMQRMGSLNQEFQLFNQKNDEEQILTNVL